MKWPDVASCSKKKNAPGAAKENLEWTFLKEVLVLQLLFTRCVSQDIPSTVSAMFKCLVSGLLLPFSTFSGVYQSNLYITHASYLCSPHDQCTFWQSGAQTCSPVGTDCSDCCRKPDLETSRAAQVWPEAPKGGWMKVLQHGSGGGRYLWYNPCLEQPDRWAGESGTSSASSWFSSGPRRPYSERSSSLWKMCRDWEWISTRCYQSQTKTVVIGLTSILLGIPMLLLLVLFFSTWRLGHVFLDGLIRLPGLRDTPAIIITYIFMSKELLRYNSYI